MRLVNQTAASVYYTGTFELTNINIKKCSKDHLEMVMWSRHHSVDNQSDIIAKQLGNKS